MQSKNFGLSTLGLGGLEPLQYCLDRLAQPVSAVRKVQVSGGLLALWSTEGSWIKREQCHGFKAAYSWSCVAHTGMVLWLVVCVLSFYAVYSSHRNCDVFMYFEVLTHVFSCKVSELQRRHSSPAGTTSIPVAKAASVLLQASLAP